SNRGSGGLWAIETVMIGGDPKAAAVEVSIGESNDVTVRAVVVAQAHDVLMAAKAAGEIKERVDRVSPGGLSFGEAVRGEQEPVLLGCKRADVFELKRVADDDGAARAEEKRQSRCDIALTGLVDHDEVEKTSFEWQPAASGERRNGPARQDFRDL